MDNTQSSKRMKKGTKIAIIIAIAIACSFPIWGTFGAIIISRIDNRIIESANINPYIAISTANYRIAPNNTLTVTITNRSNNMQVIDEIRFRVDPLSRIGWDNIRRRRILDYDPIILQPNETYTLTLSTDDIGELVQNRRHRIVFWIDGYIYTIDFHAF
ncbi:MAG: hypothetical protein FWB93_04995 [Oscillospiraceae bacterium]|nr:hypothetical protein [Oscillospiraceae bacterium]